MVFNTRRFVKLFTKSTIRMFNPKCNSNFKSVTHCLFDLDGLLMDTEGLYTQAAQEALNSYGKTFTWDIKQTLMGLQGQELAKRIVSIYKLPITWEQYRSLQLQAQDRLMTNPKFMPGAIRLICHLHCNQIPMAIATSSREASFKLKTQNHAKIFNLFHHVVCGDDAEVTAGKPAPDVFLVAASRFCNKPDPSTCLVFEDAPNGVRAARTAGMQCVMVPDERLSEELRKGATVVLSSLEHFKPEIFGLPPFSDCK